MTALDDLELELRKLPGVKAAGFDELDDLVLVQIHVGDITDTPDRGTPDRGVPLAASRLVARHLEQPSAVEIVRWRTLPAPAAPAAPGPATPEPPAPERAPAAPADSEASVVDVTAEPEPEPGPDATGADATGTGEPAPAEAGPGRRARLLAVLAFPDTDELEVHLILGGRRTIGRAATSAGLPGAVQATIEAVRELGAPFAARVAWAQPIEREHDGDRAVVAVAVHGAADDDALVYGISAGTSPTDAAARATLDALNRRMARVL